MRLRLFSLFSGAGGLDLGFTETGKFDVVFGNDIFPPAGETYSANFKKPLCASAKLNSFYLGDVASIDFSALSYAEPDVVAGGPPCQDFSIVRGPENERAGVSVSRGRLYAHFIRALTHFQPKIFVFENVPGLVSANRGLAYKIIIDDFSNLRVRWSEIKGLLGNEAKREPKSYEILFSGLVDASKLGVPQARKRVIVIGLRRDLISEEKWWMISLLKRKLEKRLSGANRPVSKYPLTPLEAFEGRPLPELCGRYREIMKEYEHVAEEVGTPLALEWKKNIWNTLSMDAVKDYLKLNGIKPANSREVDAAFDEHASILKELGYYGRRVADLKPCDGSNEVPKEAVEVVERMMRIPPGENHEFVRGTAWEVEGRGISLIYRRLHPLKPAYTVVARGGGGTWGYHYERRRSMLTNRERARLQTFPDWFMFKGTWAEVRAQIGEAVPVLMAKRIAEAVAEVLELCA